MIPYKTININDLNELGRGTLSEVLGMTVTDVGSDYVKMRMPVEGRTMQPFGVLHGGAVAALAENVGSLAAVLYAGEDKICAGQSLQCNHLKAVREGFVEATAKAIHIGKSSQVWDIEVRNDRDVLTNVCRLTLAVMDKK